MFSNPKQTTGLSDDGSTYVYYDPVSGEYKTMDAPESGFRAFKKRNNLGYYENVKGDMVLGTMPQYTRQERHKLVQTDAASTPPRIPTSNGMDRQTGRQYGLPDGGDALPDEQLQAAIDAFQQYTGGQTQQPAVQPGMAYWSGPQAPSGSDIGLQRPDYGTVQQRPAYDFTRRQMSQPAPIRQAQVQNMHNVANSTEWQDRIQGLLAMPGFGGLLG